MAKKTFAVTLASNVREYTVYHVTAETAEAAEKIVTDQDWSDDESMPVATDYEDCDDPCIEIIDVQVVEG